MSGAWILGNALAATALAGVAALLTRRVRRPGLAHAAWGAVLLRLVAVPVLEWRVLPRWSPAAPDAAALPAAAFAPGGVVAPAAVASPHAGVVLAGIAAAGTVLLLALTAVRALRFTRLLRAASPAPPELQARADALARSLGLPRAPRLRLVPARIAPAVTAAPVPEILLPRPCCRGCPRPSRTRCCCTSWRTCAAAIRGCDRWRR